MCGFIGIVSSQSVDIESLEEANKKIICRGPDNKKIYYSQENNFNIGGIFNRLSIIDLSDAANQPMVSKDNRYVLLFNGEIFNFQELRKNLINKGYKFYTSHSDTESLFNTLINYKIDAPKYLRGQFAFVFIDKIKNEIYLCRDRVGQKPLYYFTENESISFSSNLISLAQLKKSTEINQVSIIQYLTYGKIISKETIYKNIFEVHPGEIIKISLSNSKFYKNSTDYWKLEEYYDNKKFNEEEFYEIFDEAVKLRTKSDVPFATFLSGGLDSTSIIKSQKESNLDVNTFSVYMDNSKYDEKKYCEQVARTFNTNHTSLNISNNLTTKNITEILNTLDEPFADPSYIPTYLISKKISEYFKMALSGDGGDELLGGYKRTQDAIKIQKNIFNNLYSKLYKIYPPYLGTGNHFLSKDMDLKIRYSSYLSDIKLLKLLHFNKPDTELFSHYQNLEKSEYKTLMMYEYDFYLSKLMMYKVDRASMANSVEVRSPFVDNKLIEYVFSHTNEYFDFKNPKKLLKNYLSDEFNEDFTNRPKQGFMFDVKRFVYENSDYFYDNINSFEKYLSLDLKSVKKLFQIKTRINSNRIWKIFVLLNYLDNNK